VEDKRDMCLLTNIHDPPTECNYRDEHGNVIKRVFGEGRVANGNVQMCQV
jgi:hypothetical protein